MQNTIKYEDIYNYFTFKHVPSQYCSLEPPLLGGNDISEDEAKKVLYDLLIKATERLLGYGGNVLLSGGLDSSTTLHLLRECTDKKIKTFTLTYDDPGEEFELKNMDKEYARRLSNLYGTEHHEHIVSEREMLEDLPDIMRRIGTPFAGAVSSYFAEKMVLPHGAAVFTGDLSDELFGSYKAHREAQHHTGNLLKWRYSLYPFNDHEKRELFSDKFLVQISEEDISYNEMLKSSSINKDSTNAMLYYEWRTTLVDEVLVGSKKLCSALDVSPFFDPDVKKFVGSLPHHMKVRGNITKYILKETMRGSLPNYVIDRPKEGFVQPSNYWMVTQWEKDVRAAIKNNHGHFNMDYVNNLLDRYFDGDRSLVYKVWTLFCFEVWYENR